MKYHHILAYQLLKIILTTKIFIYTRKRQNYIILISFLTKQAKYKLNLKIFLREELLEQNETTKFVGLIIDENLNWSKHVDSVFEKMSSGLFALQMAK